VCKNQKTLQDCHHEIKVSLFLFVSLIFTRKIEIESRLRPSLGVQLHVNGMKSGLFIDYFIISDDKPDMRNVPAHDSKANDLINQTGNHVKCCFCHL